MPKFYQLDAQQRRSALQQAGDLSAADAAFWQGNAVLPDAVADGLSENRIGQFALPLGVCRNLPVNGRLVQVPMATEEPSVVAAASNGARLAAAGAGVHATAPEHEVLGEIVFSGLANLEAAKALVLARRDEIQTVAAAAHPSIVRRGGGLRRVSATVLDRFLKIGLVIDTQEAMGANIVNTIGEAVAAAVGGWLKHPALVAILSNAGLAEAQANVAIPVAALATTDCDGATIADRIASLSDLAQLDSQRAVTHNKGIMNGVSAAVLASGNDTRAVEAAVHAFAAESGQYRGLSRWQVADGQLHGSIALPLPVGAVGGAISALPAAQAVKRLAGYDSVADLQQCLAALGLVQNLAALRALAGPGIQAGHMALAANALAMQAGAQGAEIQRVAAALQHDTKDLATATRLLAAIRKGETR